MSQVKQTRAHAKVPLLRDRLRQLALQAGPHAKLPTMRELCTLLETSRVTLEEVLSDLEAQNVIYRKASSGIFVSPKLLRKNICILLDASLLFEPSSFWGLLWGHFARTAQARTQERDEYYSLHLVIKAPDQSPPLPEEVIRMAQSGLIHGVIMIGLNAPCSEWITEQGIPCVTFAAYGPWSVALDTVSLTRQAIALLAQQGCRKIGLWLSPLEPLPLTSPVVEPKLTMISQLSFHHSLAEHGLVLYPELIHVFHESAHVPATQQSSGYSVAQQAFGDDALLKPDGVVITHDVFAEGALAGLLSLGVQIGEDVQIATHANVGTMLLWDYIKGVTMIEYDPMDIVHSMFHMLDILIDGKQPEAHNILLQPRPRLRTP